MAGVGAVVAAIWFQFPLAWRADPAFRTRAKFLLLAQMFILVMSLQYWAFSWTFFAVPLQYQWILAILLTLVRELNTLALAAICEKEPNFNIAKGEQNQHCLFRVFFVSLKTQLILMSDISAIAQQIALGPDISVELVAHNLAISYHMIFLSVCVGGLATDATLYVLIAIDFVINIYFVVISWRAKRNHTEESLQKLMKSVQILVLAESLEIVIPLAYLLCFIIAYHGPNADILGNIKNSYWQYQETVTSMKVGYFI